MTELLKLLAAGVVIVGLHYFLWYKVYRIWLGHFERVLSKILLFAGCALSELVVVVVLLMLGLNIG